MTRPRTLLLFILWTGASLGALASPAAPTPEIHLTPLTLTINAPDVGPAPAPSTLTLQNSGDGRLKWTASSNASWLSVSPTVAPAGGLNKSESIDLSVSVSLTGLAAGTYTGKITVTDPAASNSPQSCTVTLQITASPRLSLNPASLSWTAPEGGTKPAGKSLTVQNSGGGTLNWNATYSPSWLSGSSSVGSLSAGAFQTLTVEVDTTGLGAGSHPGTITFAAPGAADAPQTVAVTLVLSQAPVIGFSPASLTFDGPQGGANPAPKDLHLSNLGGGTMAWTASTDAAWLSVSPTFDSLGAGVSEVLTVSVNTAALTEGTYLAAVHLASGTATNSPQTVPVTLNVNSQPKIGINPKTLSFATSTDVGTCPPSALSVTNAGSNTLNWSATGGASWLHISPGSGSLGALASEPLVMSIQAAGMTPGHYTTTVHIEDPNAINSPQTIAVDLSVGASDLPVSAPAGQCGLLGLEALGAWLLLRLRSRLGRQSREGSCR
jgi:hypothetical protein